MIKVGVKKVSSFSECHARKRGIAQNCPIKNGRMPEIAVCKVGAFFEPSASKIRCLIEIDFIKISIVLEVRHSKIGALTECCPPEVSLPYEPGLEKNTLCDQLLLSELHGWENEPRKIGHFVSRVTQNAFNLF